MLENYPISNYADLKLQIRDLKEQNQEQKVQLKDTLNNYVRDFQPVNIVKSSIHEIANDSIVKYDVVKIATILATNYILKKFIEKKIPEVSPEEVENQQPINNVLLNMVKSKLILGIFNLIERP